MPTSKPRPVKATKAWAQDDRAAQAFELKRLMSAAAYRISMGCARDGDDELAERFAGGSRG
jgi:hypothetical protein